MATVTRENLGTLHEKITVKLEKQDYLPTFDKTIKEYAKKANIPGFRKGMVPTGLVRKMYGQSVLTDEIIKLAGKEMENYLKNENLSIFAQPMILADQKLQFDVNNPIEYDFNFEIGIKPGFEIPAIKNKATITRYKIEITDKMLDDEIERIKKQYGTEDPQETADSNEHIVHCAYLPCDADGNIADAENKTTNTTELGKMPAKLLDMVRGKKAGDTLVIRPVDVCTEEELNAFLKNTIKNDEGSNNFYLLTIDKIGQLVPMESGAELFIKVYPDEVIADETEFRNKIKAELEHEYGRITSERLQNEIFEMLVHNTPIDLPSGFLKRYMREGGENLRTEEDVEASYPSFEHSLRWQLISDKIIGEYDIKVTRNEVLDDIMANVLSYFGVKNADEAPWLESYRSKISKDEKAMDEAYNRLTITRLFSVLETILNIDEKQIDEKDFFKLGDAHSTHHHH